MIASQAATRDVAADRALDFDAIIGYGTTTPEELRAVAKVSY